MKLHRAWYVFIGCVFFSFIGFGLVVNTPGLYFRSLTEDLNISQGSAAMMITIQQICSALTLLVAGKIIEKINAKILMASCALIFGLGFIACSFYTSIYPFYFTWGLIGIAQSFCLTLGLPLFLGNWFQKKYGLVMGIAIGLSAVGGAFFNPIVSYIITNHTWRISYRICGALMIAILLPISLTLFKLRPTGSEKPFGYDPSHIEQEELLSSNEIKSNQFYKQVPFFMFLIPIILLNFVNGYIQHIPSHVITEGFTLNFGGLCISMIMIGASIGKIVIGGLLDKYDYVRIILLFTLPSIIGWLILTYVPNEQILLASCLLLGLGQGIVLIGLPFLVRNTYGVKTYGQIFSILSMFGAFSQAFSVGTAGFIFDKFGSYRIQFTSASIFYLISFICFFILKIYNSKSKENIYE